MKMLITGGCGFIGSNFIRYIIKKYPACEIINLDKLTYAGNPENLRDLENNPNYKFVREDICNIKLVEKLMKDVDTVVHFAAESHVDRSIIEAGVFIRTDVFGTYILLKAANKFGVDKFVHISTDEVYGSIEKGSFKEEGPMNPRNPYSVSKLGADRLAYSFFVTYNLPVVITRSSNNFGPYQYPEKLLPLSITNILRNKKVPLYGDGLYVRDWLYVIDNCEAIDFLRKKGKLGEAYNVAGGNEKTNIEVIKIVLSHLGKDESWIEFVKDRPGHDRRYSLNDEKIKKLGWKPISNFGGALRETIDWYKKNRRWWEPLVIT